SFFCTDTSTTEIYTLSLHDALPISCTSHCPDRYQNRQNPLWHLSMRKAHMSRLYQYEPSAVALRSWPPLRKVLPAKTKRELSSSYITLKWRNFIMFCIVLCVCRLFHAGL